MPDGTCAGAELGSELALGDSVTDGVALGAQLEEGCELGFDDVGLAGQNL